ncbi:hypothetical protein [Cutibacterium sp. V947]|uniref:hypothetical protein n=1 Tax=Cutibacterium sp. V947 TaxID=3446480 RepID=UPI003EDFA36B
MMKSNLSMWSSGIVIADIVTLVVMIMVSADKRIDGSLGYACVFGIIFTIACVLGVLAAVKGPGSRASRWVHGIGCVVLAVAVGSFLVHDEPTTINVFGFSGVIGGVILMIVGTILVQMTRPR